jgi:hypothetical protein
MTATRIRLRWLALVLGALIGFPLGVGIHYFGSIPLYGSDSGLATNAFLLLGVGVVLLLGLWVWAGVSRSINPLLAAVAMLVVGVIGFMVGPGGPGSSQSGSGTGSAGTRQDPTAFWSGSVRCEWQQGQDATVRRIVGFDVVVRDAAVAHALSIGAGSKVVAIVLPPPGGNLANLGVARVPTTMGVRDRSSRSRA